MKYKMNIKLLPVIALALASTAVTVYQLEVYVNLMLISTIVIMIIWKVCDRDDSDFE